MNKPNLLYLGIIFIDINPNIFFEIVNSLPISKVITNKYIEYSSNI